MMRRLLQREHGVGMVLVLALMALAIPIITAALGLASTLSIDSRVKTNIAKAQYTNLGIPDIVSDILINDPDFLDSLDDDLDGDGIPDGGEFIIDINDDEVTVTVMPADPDVDDPTDGEGLKVTKQVSPTIAPADFPLPTTFTYTITVENTIGTPIQLKRIHDGLPPSFSYVGPTSGVTSSNPTETWLDNEDDEPTYLQLTWDLVSLGIEILPGESVSLSFDAQASNLIEGNYCNEAWVDPDGPESRTWKTAKVVAGTPADDVCAGEEVEITPTVHVVPSPDDPDKTRVTYTIEITNVMDITLSIWRITDKLPPGFEYVLSSTTGDITNRNPLPRSVISGHQRLVWFLNATSGGSDLPTILPGETRTLTFEADAPITAGIYYNEVWVFLYEYEDNHAGYSYPSARVTMMNVFEISIDGGAPSSEIWILNDEAQIYRWNIGQ